MAHGLLLIVPMMTRMGGWRGVVAGAAFTLVVAGLQAFGRARATPAGPIAQPAGAIQTPTGPGSRDLVTVAIDDLRGRVGLAEPPPLDQP